MLRNVDEKQVGTEWKRLSFSISLAFSSYSLGALNRLSSCVYCFLSLRVGFATSCNLFIEYLGYTSSDYTVVIPDS